MKMKEAILEAIEAVEEARKHGYHLDATNLVSLACSIFIQRNGRGVIRFTSHEVEVPQPKEKKQEIRLATKNQIRKLFQLAQERGYRRSESAKEYLHRLFGGKSLRTVTLEEASKVISKLIN